MRVLAFAVALPSLGPAAQAPRGSPVEATVEQAVERGVAALLAEQQAGGAWTFGGVPRAGATALALYALLESGLPRDHEAVARALTSLRDLAPPGTYDAALMILALVRHGAREHLGWIQEEADVLVGWQNPHGDWGYPNGADLSNTQFAALGLWAASGVGARVDAAVWERLAKVVLERYSERDGGFGYSARGGSTTSMTAAGVGTLAICRARLARSAGDERDQATLRRIERGLAWLADEFDDFQPSSWSEYGLYGVERVGALTGSETFGGTVWYDAGARALLAQQLEDGTFGGRGTSTPTAFALLFLRRATRAVVSPRGEDATPVVGNQDADADVHVVLGDQDPPTLWITGFGARALAELEWPGETGRGPHVARVVYLADGAPLGELGADPARPAEEQRFALQVELPLPPPLDSGGARELAIVAHVLVQGPPSASPSGRALPGAPRWIASRPFRVALEQPEGAVPPVPELDERAANLLRSAGARARASSSWESRDGGAHPAESAVDGRLRTAWIAAPADPRASLALELERPQRADVLLVAHARALPHAPGALGRALEIEVIVNDGAPRLLRMDPDELVKGRLALGEPLLVRTLELRLGPIARGSVLPAAGVAEVELLLEAR